MKIKCIRSCTGVGYENFKKGQTKNLKKGLAEKLVAFGYAIEAKGEKSKVTDETPNGDEIPTPNDDKSNGNDE